MNNTDNISEIDRYLRNEMDHQETESFKQRLSIEPDLMKMYQEISDAQAAIRIALLNKKLDLLREVEIKDPMDQKEVELDLSHTANQYKKGANKPYWLLLIILILGGLLIYYLWHSSKTIDPTVGEELYAEYFEPLMQGVIVRGDDHKYSRDKIRAYELYNGGRYDESSKALFEVFLSEKDTVSALYAAISFMQIGNLNRADTLLTISNKESMSLYDAHQWYHILLLLKSGDLLTAKIELQSLIGTDHYKSEIANQLLQKLNNLLTK